MKERQSSLTRAIPVLMYHHVTPKGGFIACSVSNFESQMKALVKSGYSTLSAEQFAGFLRGDKVPEKSVVLTFDDGYLNNFVYAHPILQKYGLQALMFLITEHIHHGPIRPVMGSGHVLPDCPIHQDCKQLIEDGLADDVMVRWDEVREMEGCGTFSFHSHTHTHKRWDLAEGVINKNEEIRKDLSQSQVQLNEQLSKVSNHLCWPQGYFDDDYVKIAQELGFKNLYTTEPYGFNVAGGNSAHIYRIAAKNKSGLWLLQRLWFAKDNPVGRWYSQSKLKKRAKKARRKQSRRP